MNFKVKCPKCGKKVKLKTKHYIKNSKCESCGTDTNVSKGKLIVINLSLI